MGAEPFSVHLREEVEDDLRLLGRGDQDRIFRANRERLTTQPESYGKPLGGSLAGLRRIRVGDFRVAYQICGRKVIVWAIKNRKEIYADLELRFRKH